ncbi:hypothetical protein ABEB36_002904 [Hypothenemus hampei]|uniref:Uncharacterized protein n=1 Tax=Hypothenemus hampei TaxID=57062 RepID=A0ABD1FA13_HYPHA
MNAFLSGVVILVAIVSAHAGIITPAALNLVATPAILRAAPLQAVEGQYIHDNTERLYDDGSYRPELRAVPLAASPYGLTVAGSGLEGAYVPDINEKLYDDGSYKAELRTVPLANSPYGLTPAGSGLEGAYVPELRAVPLAPSPYGLTPAGSGLEGAYVPDINEKLYDDGSYRPGLGH